MEDWTFVTRQVLIVRSLIGEDNDKTVRGLYLDFLVPPHSNVQRGPSAFSAGKFHFVFLPVIP
jgi:hypothetical protein